MKKIPLAYRLLHQRLLERAEKGNLMTKGRAKFIVSYSRTPRPNLPELFKELKEFGLIDFENSHSIKVNEISYLD